MMRCDWARNKIEHLVPEAHIIAELEEKSRKSNHHAQIMPSMDCEEMPDGLLEENDDNRVIIIEI